MVDVPGKAAFLARQLSQAAATTNCAKLLQLVPQSPVSIAHVLDRLARMAFPIAIGCDVAHAQVNAKCAINILERSFLDRTGHQQIPLAAMKQQITFALAICKHRSLALATDERDRLSAIKCPDRDRRVGQGEREDAFIVGDAGVRAKGAFGLFVQLVSIADFGERAYSYLCRQAKGFTHILIAQLLKRKPAESSTCPGHITNVVTRDIGRFKRALERIGLFGRRQQLQLCSQFHLSKYNTFVRVIQLWAQAAKARRFLRVSSGRRKRSELPRLKASICEDERSA
jgi:hypothetical protein